jgi:hypothetical protein
MGRVSGRPWMPSDDVTLKELAAAGKYVVTIAVEMCRSEPNIRKKAKEIGVEIVKNPLGRHYKLAKIGLKAKEE